MTDEFFVAKQVLRAADGRRAFGAAEVAASASATSVPIRLSAKSRLVNGQRA
jgi:hypothetical protein